MMHPLKVEGYIESTEVSSDRVHVGRADRLIEAIRQEKLVGVEVPLDLATSVRELQLTLHRSLRKSVLYCVFCLYLME